MTRNKLLIIAALVLAAGFAVYSKVVKISQKQVLLQQESSTMESEPVTKDVVANSLAESPWPAFQADMNRSGRSIYEGLDNLRKKWVFQVNSIVESSVVIGVDGSLYFGAYDSNFYSITRSGKMRWKFPTRGPVRATAAIAKDGTIYVASRDGTLYALNSHGKAKWIRVLSEKPIDSSPVIGPDGTIFVGCHNGYLYAVNPDGTLRWVSEPLGHISASSPAVAEDGTIYIGSYDGSLYALDNNNGRVKWKFRTSGGVRASPSISGGTIYIGSRSGILYAVNSNGTLKWKFNTKGDIRSSAAVSEDGKIFFGSWDGYFYAVSNKGRLLWKYDTGRPIEASVSMDRSGNVYFTSITARLYVLNPYGKLKQKLKTATFIHGTPVLDADGTVYLTAGTRVLAFGIPLPALDLTIEKREFSLKEPIKATLKLDNKYSENISLDLKVWLDFIESGQRKIITVEDRLVPIIPEGLIFDISLNPFIKEGDEGLYQFGARVVSPVTGEEIDYKEIFFYRHAE